MFPGPLQVFWRTANLVLPARSLVNVSAALFYTAVVPPLGQGVRWAEGAQEGVWSVPGPPLAPGGAQSLSPA